MRIVFHEYAHLITSNIAGSIPVWLNEGLAEFYSTFETVGDREALIGRPVPGHLDRLNETPAAPLEELLNVKHDSALYNEGDRRSVFYAQSWALTHLLLVAQPSRRDKLGAYVAKVEDGIRRWRHGRRRSAADRIGPRAAELHPAQRVQRLPIQVLGQDLVFDGVATPVAAADAEALLALFLAQQDRYDEAAERLQRAATLDPTTSGSGSLAAPRGGAPGYGGGGARVE